MSLPETNEKYTLSKETEDMKNQMGSLKLKEK